LQTALCRQLGLDHPIFSVGFGAGAGPELAAAVSNAGACGVLGSSGQPARYVRQQIRRLRELTTKPFGVNVILAVLREGVLEACLDERPPILVFFWGDPAPHVDAAHRRGIKVLIQVGTVEEAQAAAAAGVDAIIAQGIEAGGHVKGKTSLWTLLPQIVDTVRPVPVIAAGGIADGRGVVAALALGAQAVSMGTRFVASEEAFVHAAFKRRVVESRAEDTIYCDLFDVGWPNAPHRALRNKAVEEWEAAGRPRSGERPGEGSKVGTVARGGEVVDVQKYSAMMLTPEFEGCLDYVPMWAGESCTLVNDIKPAGQIVRDVVREAEGVIGQFGTT
jgi:nitronate monooxygenase